MTPEQKTKASKLKRLGHSYREISNILKLPYHQVYLYLHGKKPQVRKTTLETILHQKLYCFCRIKVSKLRTGYKCDFTIQDLLDKFGPNPICYLTGEPIDLLKPETYQFDHIVSRSKGGDNSLSNLGLASKAANQAKSDLSLDDFKTLCKKVLDHNPSYLKE